MNEDITDEEKINLTPEKGFNLVGIDFFEVPGKRLYLIEHFEMYQDALLAKKGKKHSDDYYILYKRTDDEYFCR